MEATARSSQPAARVLNTLAQTFAAARRQQIEPLQLFHCRELQGHTNSIWAMEFSGDGAFLISGGSDETVRLWSLNQGRNEENSVVMKTKQKMGVRCLAFSPDNKRIFSGGEDKTILIHDTQT